MFSDLAYKIGSLFGYYAPLPLSRALAYLGLRGMGFLNSRDQDSGERWFFKRYERHIKSVVDIGAHKGETLLRLGGICSYVGFEPNPTSFSFLEETTKRFEGKIDAKVFNCAIGDKPGQLELYDYLSADGSSHASLYKETFERLFDAESEKHIVETKTLDDFVSYYQSGGQGGIDLLKIDTEGNEYKVIKGGIETIRQVRPRFIIFEFNQHAIFGHYHYFDIFDALRGTGVKYRFYRLRPRGLLPIDDRRLSFDSSIFLFSNIVCIRADTQE